MDATHKNGRRSNLSQARLVICCVTLLATEAAVGGVWLHAHGFQGGAGLTLIVLSNSISGLIGFLGGRESSQQLTLPTEAPKIL